MANFGIRPTALQQRALCRCTSTELVAASGLDRKTVLRGMHGQSLHRLCLASLLAAAERLTAAKRSSPPEPPEVGVESGSVPTAERERVGVRGCGVGRGSAPEMEMIALACGLHAVVECKDRDCGLPLVREAIAQANRYCPAAVPVACFRIAGAPVIVALSLEHFRQIAGLAPTRFPARPGLLLGRRGRT